MMMNKQSPIPSPTRGPARRFGLFNALCAALAALVLALPAASWAQDLASPCARVAGWTQGDARVLGSEFVAAGQFAPPQAGLGRLAKIPGLDPTGHARVELKRAFCRVTLQLVPDADSDIRAEVWLPVSGWNGKFMASGSFGWGGEMMYSGMMGPLQEGYATASSDTGHDASQPGQDGGRFLQGHPARLTDYAYRAFHETTVAAKALIRRFYGQAPTHAYWVGCSLGGLEGLIEAKRYPDDYDGIVVGAPPNPLAAFNAAQLWPYWLIAQDPRRLIPPEKFTMVHQAVMQACGSARERQDDVLDRPDQCRFMPAQLACRAGDAPDCLTAAQVDLLEKIYAGPANPRTGERIFPGPALGTERDFSAYASSKPFQNALDLFRYVVFENPDWQPDHFDWDKDMALAMRKASLLSVEPDLGAFFARGGKLIFYIGWNDYHNPAELIDYYQKLVKASGRPARDVARLFASPGMGHCFGGSGCDTFDKLGAISGWVEQGTAPERLIAARVDQQGKVVRTRALCAYPDVARPAGPGDSGDAANGVCQAP
jgi:feruloyl esterase